MNKKKYGKKTNADPLVKAVPTAINPSAGSVNNGSSLNFTGVIARNEQPNDLLSGSVVFSPATCFTVAPLITFDPNSTQPDQGTTTATAVNTTKQPITCTATLTIVNGDGSQKQTTVTVNPT